MLGLALPFPLGPGWFLESRSSFIRARLRLVPDGWGKVLDSRLQQAGDVVADGSHLVEGVVQGPFLGEEIGDGLPEFPVRGEKLLGCNSAEPWPGLDQGELSYSGVEEFKIGKVCRVGALRKTVWQRRNQPGQEYDSPG